MNLEVVLGSCHLLQSVSQPLISQSDLSLQLWHSLPQRLLYNHTMAQNSTNSCCRQYCSKRGWACLTIVMVPPTFDTSQLTRFMLLESPWIHSSHAKAEDCKIEHCARIMWFSANMQTHLGVPICFNVIWNMSSILCHICMYVPEIRRLHSSLQWRQPTYDGNQQPEKQV